MREENMTAAETRYKACFFCEGERGTNYSVSELGGFAGSALAEATGRADVGRQKDKEAREKAEREAAKNKGDTGQSGEGFINALGAGLIRIKNDLKDLWDGIGGIASRTLGLLRYGEISNSSDYNMTDDEYSEWMKYKNEQAAKGIEVANGKFEMRDMVEYGSLKYYEAKSVLDDDIIFVTKTEGKGKTAISYTGGVVDPNATKTVFDAVRFDKDGNSIASESFKANVE